MLKGGGGKGEALKNAKNLLANVLNMLKLTS